MIIRMRMTMKTLSLMFLTLLILVVLIMSKQAEAGRAGVKIGHYRLIDAPCRRIIDGVVHPGCNGVPVVKHYYTPSSNTYEHDCEKINRCRAPFASTSPKINEY
ncbi:hypothetical protein TorRG33x02_288230 [Trema orientale]|uniref:Rapid ALkalinization Factor n=1 Tax=Trema orientale TaxID=63057 RepID=A0A2P5CE52_TREOI|nr:hypothetical protein TorRG33x02_288230 [Trema orientale]